MAVNYEVIFKNGEINSSGQKQTLNTRGLTQETSDRFLHSILKLDSWIPIYLFINSIMDFSSEKSTENSNQANTSDKLFSISGELVGLQCLT